MVEPTNNSRKVVLKVRIVVLVDERYDFVDGQERRYTTIQDYFHDNGIYLIIDPTMGAAELGEVIKLNLMRLEGQNAN